MASNTEIMSKLNDMDDKLDSCNSRLSNLEGRHEAEDKLKRSDGDWWARAIAMIAILSPYLPKIFQGAGG